MVNKESVKLIIAELEKSVKDIESKYEKNKAKRELSKKSIIVKGYDVVSENDLNELIAGDVITSTEHERYLNKLHKVQKEVAFTEKDEALESALDYFRRELSNARMNLEE